VSQKRKSGAGGENPRSGEGKLGGGGIRILISGALVERGSYFGRATIRERGGKAKSQMR